MKLLSRATAIEAAIDVLVLAGYSATVYGVWSIYAPAGYIVGGALAMLAGLRLGR